MAKKANGISLLGRALTAGQGVILHLNMRRNFFTGQVTEQWNRLARENLVIRLLSHLISVCFKYVCSIYKTCNLYSDYTGTGILIM